MVTKVEKQRQQEELIAEIFALFEKVDCNVSQPNKGADHEKCSWVQARPLVKGSWKYFKADGKGEFPINVISIYITTSKIMLQGSGKNQVIYCKEGQLLLQVRECIALFCK